MVKDDVYEIKGLGIRAFHKYKNVWAPKKKQELPLGLDGSLVVIQKGVKKTTVGTAPGGEIQKGFRELINAEGTIVAKCEADVERDGPAGPEIACTYKLTVPRKPLAKNALKRIKKGVEEQKKLLKTCGKLQDITVQIDKATQKNDAIGNKKAKPEVQAKAVYPLQADKVLEPKASTSGLTAEKEKDDQKIIDGTSNSSQKRKKDQTKEGSSIKKKRPAIASSTVTLNDDDQIQLNEKDIGCISQTVGSNWKILGSQLGLSSVLLTNIEASHSNTHSTVVFDMLVKWRAVEKSDATLGSFIRAMNNCPTVMFQQPDLDNIFKEIRKKYRLSTSKANGQGDAEHCKSEMPTQDKDTESTPENKTHEDSQRKEFVFNSGQKCQFLDADGHVETVTQVQAKALVAAGVCIVQGPSGTGTGFE